MQGKGLIKFLVIAVSIACLYSLSFTFVTRKVEKDAESYAKGDMAKEKAYLDTIYKLLIDASEKECIELKKPA